MEGHCSTGQSPQGAVVPMEEEEEVRCVKELETNHYILMTLKEQEIDEAPK